MSSFFQSLFGGSIRSAATHTPLIEDQPSSIGDGHPLRPRMRLPEEGTWNSEGGRGHLRSQPDQSNNPGH